VVRLFTEDATYRETPFDEVMRGREAIRAYWRREVAERQEETAFHWDRVYQFADHALVHWTAAYTRRRDGRRFRLDGVFVLEFDESSGRCRTLREWWHLEDGSAA
jgi:ketosteroid isomerase-like protein